MSPRKTDENALGSCLDFRLAGGIGSGRNKTSAHEIIRAHAESEHQKADAHAQTLPFTKDIGSILSWI